MDATERVAAIVAAVAEHRCQVMEYIDPVHKVYYDVTYPGGSQLCHFTTSARPGRLYIEGVENSGVELDATQIAALDAALVEVRTQKGDEQNSGNYVCIGTAMAYRATVG